MFDYLHNKIDICREPFSDIGSRLLVLRSPGKSELIIKLAERLTSIEPGLGTYLNRPPFIQELRFLNEKGNILNFSLTTSPEKLTFSTSIGNFFIVFQDQETIAVGLPENQVVGIHFLLNNSFLKLNTHGGEIKKIKNVLYQTNGKIIKNTVQKKQNGEVVEIYVESNIDNTIGIRISDQNNISIEARKFSTLLSEAKNRWAKIFDQLPPVLDQYQEKYAFAWWVLLNNLVSPSGMLTRETVMPSKAKYIGAWLWDSALHAIALRHLDFKLAKDQVRLMLDHQLADGMLPDAIYDEGVVSEIDHPIHARVTKPPIMAWAALKLYESDQDVGFIKEIYYPLVRENAWWVSQNDVDANGLVEYAHPYSSGLDDNPLWDGEMPVESPDINTYLYLQMEALSRMAEILEKEDESVIWMARADEILTRMISTMWDEDRGVFWATHKKRRISVLTPFSLFPLWTGKLPKNIVKKIIINLTDPESFGGKFSVPTVARNDKMFNPEKMWRGPIWANINYFLIEALQRNNEFALSKELRNKTLNLIAENSGIFEYYNANTGSPPAEAAPIFSWTAAVFIELAIQATMEATKENQ